MQNFSVLEKKKDQKFRNFGALDDGVGFLSPGDRDKFGRGMGYQKQAVQGDCMCNIILSPSTLVLTDYTSDQKACYLTYKSSLSHVPRAVHSDQIGCICNQIFTDVIILNMHSPFATEKFTN